MLYKKVVLYNQCEAEVVEFDINADESEYTAFRICRLSVL